MKRSSAQFDPHSANKLLRWTLFGIVFALAPFGITALFRWSDGKPFDVQALWPQGELLIASATLAADALGGVIGNGEASSRAKLISAAGCVLIVLAAGAWFGKIQTASSGVNVPRIIGGSAVIFAITLVASVLCKKQ